MRRRCRYAESDGCSHGFGSRRYLELGKSGGDVMVHRTHRTAKALGNLRVSQAFAKQSDDYYWVGDYKVSGNAIAGRGKVVLHTAIPNVPTIFGDVTAAFNVELNGVIGNDKIDGSMRRPDLPAINLPVAFLFRERLP
jgi:hypothetical protein